MGRIIVDQHVSADNFAADADGGLEWVRSAGDIDATDDEQLVLLEGVSAILLGGATYRMFVEFWPTADLVSNPIAAAINATPKHVISRAMTAVPWGEHEPGRLETAAPEAVAAALRAAYNGDVIVWGSLTITDALFQANEVDILRLRVVPVLIGRGRPVTPELAAPRPMRLVDAHAGASGLAMLTYSLR